MFPFLLIMCLIAGGCRHGQHQPAPSTTTTTTTTQRPRIYVGDDRVTTNDPPVLDDDDLARIVFPIPPGAPGSAENPIIIGSTTEGSEEEIIIPRNCNENSTEVTTTTTTTPRPSSSTLSICNVNPLNAVAMRGFLGWPPYHLHQPVQPCMDPEVTAYIIRARQAIHRHCCGRPDSNWRFCQLLYLERFMDSSNLTPPAAVPPVPQDPVLPSTTIQPQIRRWHHDELRKRRSQRQK